MEENKKRLMEAINRNFDESGEILVRAEYEESARTEQEERDEQLC